MTWSFRELVKSLIPVGIGLLLMIGVIEGVYALVGPDGKGWALVIILVLAILALGFKTKGPKSGGGTGPV